MSGNSIGQHPTLTTYGESHGPAIGGSVMPDEDHVSTDQYTFKVTTQSRKTGAMLANTNECYLGSVIDPETQAMTTSSFLAQFHMPEGFSLPAKSELITDANGKVVADSCVLRILHDKYYGDSLTTMKLYVQELDTAKTLSEKSSYYTDIDPTQFLSTTTAQRKTITYTALDQTKSASVLNNKKLYRDISVWLSTDFGSGKILPMRHNLIAKYTDIRASRNSLEKPPKASLLAVEGWLFSCDIFG